MNAESTKAHEGCLSGDGEPVSRGEEDPATNRPSSTDPDDTASAGEHRPVETRQNVSDLILVCQTLGHLIERLEAIRSTFEGQARLALEAPDHLLSKYAYQECILGQDQTVSHLSVLLTKLETGALPVRTAARKARRSFKQWREIYQRPEVPCLPAPLRDLQEQTEKQKAALSSQQAANDRQWSVILAELKELQKRMTGIIQEPAKQFDSARRFPGHVFGASLVGISVDVVVPVHNAPEDTANCLRSLVDGRTFPYEVILVDDASDEPTRSVIDSFVRDQDFVSLVRHPTCRGYTRSANDGIRTSRAHYVIMLNSDTVVPKGWVERLLECGESDPLIGVIGPLSNAASHQSVPEVFGCDGGWMVNPLPPTMTIADMDHLVETRATRAYPRVNLVNGFCLAIKRPVIDAIGHFDELLFLRGYGEENDFCLRARDAGFHLAIADHLYVFHAKSRSFTAEGRRPLSRAGNEKLLGKYGAKRIENETRAILENTGLSWARDRLKTALSSPCDTGTTSRAALPRVVYILPISDVSGGAHSVVQEAHGLRQLGAHATVAVPAAQSENVERFYPEFANDLFLFYEDEEALRTATANYDFCVATHFTTVEILARLQSRVSGGSTKALYQPRPAYYIQDYEPWIVKKGTPPYHTALKTYTQIPDCLLFAKTDWLCRKIWQEHGVAVHKVSPSLDSEVYHGKPASRGDGRVLTLAAMIRPRTPRRGAAITMRVLGRIAERLGDRVRIVVFGCRADDESFLRLHRDFRFDNRGVLTRAEVAGVLREADVFLDFSTYQAFGRTVLEAMACGCTAIVPRIGGSAEFARHRFNAIVADTSNERTLVAAVSGLADNPALLRKLQRNAWKTAGLYNIRRASSSILAMFNHHLARRASDHASVED